MNQSTKVTKVATTNRLANDYDEAVARMMVFTETGYQSVQYHNGKRNLSDFLTTSSIDRR